MQLFAKDNGGKHSGDCAGRVQQGEVERALAEIDHDRRKNVTPDPATPCTSTMNLIMLELLDLAHI
jgi:hypothetical protein